MPPHQARSRALLVAATWPVGGGSARRGTTCGGRRRCTAVRRSGTFPRTLRRPSAKECRRTSCSRPATASARSSTGSTRRASATPRRPPRACSGRSAATSTRSRRPEFARFVKTSGAPDELRVGDEYLVRMPGTLGRARAGDRSGAPPRSAWPRSPGTSRPARSTFRARDDGGLVFEIESWARSGDRLSNLLYTRLRMAKEVQLHMWTSVLERVVRVSGGRLEGGLDDPHTSRRRRGRG